MPSASDQARRQALANLSALPHYSSFAEHRNRLTRVALEAATTLEAPSLCVLGAGNCFDLDLNALAHCYSAIHLVDIDASALARASERQQTPTQKRLVLHAPADCSGLLNRIERWARYDVTPAELLGHAERTARQMRAELQGPFDVVLSSCILSQMQLSVLEVLTDRHRLFQAVRLTLNLTHLRTLAELTRPTGCALFATDASSSELHQFPDLAPNANCRPFLSELVEQGRVFDFADPDQLATQLRDDPVLRHAFDEFRPCDAWVWNNGPHTQFLVYAARLRRL